MKTQSTSHKQVDGTLRLGYQPYIVGCSSVEEQKGKICLINHAHENRERADPVYTNAQLDDYQQLKRTQFLWKPPLILTVQACFSHAGVRAKHTSQGNNEQASLIGTAGFGFWNDPFMMTGRRMPMLPRAIWFFYSSPPSNMKLAMGMPGPGWKAATIDTNRLPFLALLPTAPIAILLMHIRLLYRLLWPIAQRTMNVSETPVQTRMDEWHTYTIRWEDQSAQFCVDGEKILDCNTSPRGPLGLVIWIDNQYMVVTPQGQFRHGCLSLTNRQWLAIKHISIKSEE